MKGQFQLTEIENMALLLTLEKQQAVIEEQLKPLDDAIGRIVQGVASRLGVSPETIRIDPRTGVVSYDSDLRDGPAPIQGTPAPEAAQEPQPLELLIPGDPRMIKSIENSKGRTAKVKS